jgi:flavin reductase (DIM6/NTAB) family NADH-FMN oxidoreductase RutF
VLKVDPALIHRLFYPQVPAVMSAASCGRVSAMPVVSYASVSEVPPMAAVSCTPWSFTTKLAMKSGAFSLSLLGREHLKAVERLATMSGAKVDDKLSAAGLAHRPGKELAAPVISMAEATLECELHSKRKLGDHVLLVGLVRAASASNAFSDFWDFRRYRPMLYTGWKGRMTTWEG